MQIKTQTFGGDIPADAISVGPETHLGRGLRSAYKEWLWHGIQRQNPYVIAQLNAIAAKAKAMGGSVTLMHDASQADYMPILVSCVEWWVQKHE